ncbi:hypothetical protein HJA95_21900 [Rhizobium binae]|uniref:hypothetical protein n=1 Tax=Rhizobium binae TaxID=1138190 RepID=UPI001C834872|nr:hypothetical protein [Rhizobium binae]MBX4952159.1 hypothetical protein [Rhizobium binae]
MAFAELNQALMAEFGSLKPEAPQALAESPHLIGAEEAADILKRVARDFNGP